MDIVPSSEVFQTDKRNTKKMLLPIDAICVKCGTIFNSYYEDDCVTCIGPEDKNNKEKGDKDDNKSEDTCDHKEFINGRESVDLRILLDFHMEDLRALCELHGCSSGCRSKIVINIMRKLYPVLDKRIDEFLIEKMMKRNKKRFHYWKDIADAMKRVKKSEKRTNIKLIGEEECIEITSFPGRKEESIKVIVTPLDRDDNVSKK